MIRVQRRRTRGWRMPEGAVYVGRGSRWGNPWRIGDETPEHLRCRWWPRLPACIDARAAALLYGHTIQDGRGFRAVAEFLEPLRGRILVCWCPTGFGTWCHADTIAGWFEAHPLAPGPGVRPVFGLHRQEPENATAPAWPALWAVEARRVSAYRSYVKRALEAGR